MFYMKYEMVQELLSFKLCIIKEHNIIPPGQWMVVFFPNPGRTEGNGTQNSHVPLPPKSWIWWHEEDYSFTFLILGGKGGVNFPFILH